MDKLIAAGADPDFVAAAIQTYMDEVRRPGILGPYVDPAYRLEKVLGLMRRTEEACARTFGPGGELALRAVVWENFALTLRTMRDAALDHIAAESQAPPEPHFWLIDRIQEHLVETTSKFSEGTADLESCSFRLA